jgi:F-type H+-transporting ATPase subunit gamma
MSNLKEVRTRIKAIRSTRQITSAMKMVAASKLHKAQQSIQPLRLFAGQLREVIEGILPQLPDTPDSPYFKAGGGGEALVISVSSNKGLCGTYNAMAIKKTLTHIRTLEEEGYRVKMLLIGKKAEQYFAKREFEVFSIDHDLVEKVAQEGSARFSRTMLEGFFGGKFERLDVVYYQFKNAVFQELVVEQVLPMTFESLASAEKDANSGLKNEPEHPDDYFGYILEPDPEVVRDTLIPQFLATNFYRIFLEASASEHGARMTSMHKATDNADELLHSLTLTYNKARQAMITREIMEIVGGAEVLRQ